MSWNVSDNVSKLHSWKRTHQKEFSWLRGRLASVTMQFHTYLGFSHKEPSYCRERRCLESVSAFLTESLSFYSRSSTSETTHYSLLAACQRVHDKIRLQQWQNTEFATLRESSIQVLTRVLTIQLSGSFSLLWLQIQSHIHTKHIHNTHHLS